LIDFYILIPEQVEPKSEKRGFWSRFFKPYGWSDCSPGLIKLVEHCSKIKRGTWRIHKKAQSLL